ncbi:MAG: hypothetical protein VX617_04000, partial [Pseudomonadota bacterium]|nr:hypothetical protein [Pseudomonadota bacterium]
MPIQIFITRCVYVTLLALSSIIFCSFPDGLLAQGRGAEELSNQLDRIQRDVNVLSRKVFNSSNTNDSAKIKETSRQTSSSNAYISRVEDRMEQLEGETRATTGAVENIANKLNTIAARLDSFINDVNFRLDSIEQEIKRRATLEQLGPGSRRRAARSNNRELKITPVPGADTVQRSGNATGGSTIGGGNG